MSKKHSLSSFLQADQDESSNAKKEREYTPQGEFFFLEYKKGHQEEQEGKQARVQGEEDCGGNAGGERQHEKEIAEGRAESRTCAASQRKHRMRTPFAKRHSASYFGKNNA